MKKALSILLLSLGLLAYSESKAQMQLGLDLGPSLPIGDFNDYADTGLGFKFIFKYFFDDNLALMANLGYSNFDNEDNDFFGRGRDRFDFNILPININIEYYFEGDKVQPYLSGGLGIYSLSIGDDDIFDDNRYSSTEVGLDLGGGLVFPIKDKIYLSGDLKFHLIENASFIGLNFGVLFDLK